MTAAKDRDTRERILHAAAELLAQSGGEPVSTRAVCQAAGVGAPTLYHHFGDKRGLLDAVAAYGFERYLAEKRAMPPADDPVQRLRDGWDLHVEFGLRHPAFYVVMYGSAQPGKPPTAAAEGQEILLGMLNDVARAGRLAVAPETAARMIHSAAVGVVLTLIAEDRHAPDDLSARTRDALIAAVTTPDEAAARGDTPLAAQATALRATLTASSAGIPLTAAERTLLDEWLDRLAASSA
ncbi:TetR/AcrR family transcriptional regulator [Thermoactinospora rubra]|uniref:TetR/AcrR family transcriptional regulator n=1 Tax=Thermoactinospora rubra TaxID=1088767 RepID=UPI000A1110DA|nr:TetR/AcrR family transcriptional regulator [Thermoactinospora rubra]